MLTEYCYGAVPHTVRRLFHFLSAVPQEGGILGAFHKWQNGAEMQVSVLPNPISIQFTAKPTRYVKLITDFKMLKRRKLDRFLNATKTETPLSMKTLLSN